jgi:uncharacterized membrane protein (UPF0127 family)
MKLPFSVFLSTIRNLSSSLSLAVVGTLLIIPSTGYTQDGPQLNLPRVSLQAGMHRIEAQVAQSGLEKQIGLMYRKSMPVHEGMLFIFAEPSEQCFWMKNTELPLTAAFIADDGTIINLEDMKPQTLTPHCSKKPVRYVLEMNIGWFKSKKINAGFQLKGAPFNR